MALLSSIKDHHSERRLFVARVFFSGSVSILLLGFVIARLVQLQIVDYEHFTERSQGNRVRIEAVPPIRGLVFDRLLDYSLVPNHLRWRSATVAVGHPVAVGMGPVPAVV